MKVQVRLFAQLRERAGERVEVDLADGATVADALAALGGEGALGELLARMPITVAVNREYADRSQPLAPGDEVALIPPVSGGAGRVHARVTTEPLDPAAVAVRVAE